MIAALPLVASAVAAGAPSASAAASTAAATVAGSAGLGDSFSSLLTSFTQDTVDKMKTSEQMSIAGMTGKATTQSVVESVMSAQEQLSTALAVRDKAVAAFQDISRMPI